MSGGMIEVRDSLKDAVLIWGKFYCKEHFSKPTPRFHLDILESALNYRYVAIASPRESAKSTLLAFLVPLHGICYQKYHFIAIVQNTYKKASMSLENIKREILDNDRIKRHFNIQLTKDAEGDSIFKHADGFETRILCKGAEQIGSIRGEKFAAYRPDLIIGDDMEDDELVLNPERRRYLQELFDDALIPAGDRDKCHYIFIGTILHDDSQMAKLVSTEYYSEYHKIIYQALNEEKQLSLWEEKWSVEYLNWLKKNKPTTYAKEMQNDPVSGLLGKFKRNDFRYWHVENDEYILFDEQNRIKHRGRLDECKAAISCDLAWEEKRQNDDTVIMPAFLTPQADILVEEYICKKGMRPSEIEEVLFSMELRLRSITGSSVFIGFEKAQLEKVIQHLLRQAMSKRNQYLLFKDLAWDKDKINRIVTRLEPRYAQHSIYHKRGMGELEHQLLRVPSGVHDDLPDALQGIVQLLQYPKQKKKYVPEDSEFEWYRKKAIEAKHPRRPRYIFGQKGDKRWGIAADQSYR